VADDRQALIETLTEEGWEQDATFDDPLLRNRDIVMACFDAEVWMEGKRNAVRSSFWQATFDPATPNSVILAAARAAVEAEQ